MKNVGSKYYYTAPIGKQVSYTSSDSSTSNVTIDNRDELYFDQISNFASLKGSKIMLGSDIYKSTSDLAQEFRNAIGSKIILSCYYYIAPVGSLVNGNYEPTELYFRQYLVTGETNETQTITTYVDASGNTYSNPEVDKDADGKVKYNYKTGFFIYDPNSIKINADAKFALDQTSNHIYSSISGTTPQIDEKGSTHNKAEESYNFIYSDSNEFEFTVDGVSYTYKKDQGAKKAGDSSTYKIISKIFNVLSIFSAFKNRIISFNFICTFIF